MKYVLLILLVCLLLGGILLDGKTLREELIVVKRAKTYFG